MRLFRSVAGLSAIAIGLIVTGCGSSSNSTTDSFYRIVNAVPNSGSAALTSSAGVVTTTPFQVTSYSGIASGTSNVAFALSAQPGIVYPTKMVNLSSNFYYSFFIVGRADITNASSPSYPQLVVSGDSRTSPSGGDFEIRVAHTAPDAGNVDVLVNGALEQSDVAYTDVDPYINIVQGASTTIEIRKTGTASDVVPLTTVTTSSGHIYTLILTEPTTAPTYSAQLVEDL